MEFYNEFYSNPDNYIPINLNGDLYLRWFNERYAALRMINVKPIFEKAFQLLTKGRNFSRTNAFGEIPRDGYLWVMRHKKIKVIVEERQSHKYIYIDTGYSFHIRALEYVHNFPLHTKNELKGINLLKFKKQGYEPYCPDDVNSKRFEAFTYGDERDTGYVLSMEYYSKGIEKCEHVNTKTITAIQNIESWEEYLIT